MTTRSPDTVDYIVIGAGSAGCVVANRLSADPGCSVLLLEAGGPDDHLFLRMPLAFLKAMFKPQFVWNYMSEPEPQLERPPAVAAARSSIGRQLFHQRHVLYARPFERF